LTFAQTSGPSGVGPSISISTADEYYNSIGSHSGAEESSTGGHGSSTKKYYNYVNLAANAVEVNLFTDYSLVENGLPVYGEVGIIKEIRNSLTKAINGLTICERIDRNVEFQKEPVCYITYFGTTSSKIMFKLMDNIPLDAKNDSFSEIPPITNDKNTRSFYIPYLGAKGRIIIYYKILSKSVGINQLGTSVRYNEKDYRDSDYYFKLKSEFPVEITAVPDRNKLFTGPFNFGPKNTSIAYDLVYRNVSSGISNRSVNVAVESKNRYYEIKGLSVEGYLLGVNGTIDDLYEYKKYGDRIYFILPFGKDVRINMDVEYFNEGEYDIPHIFLDNNQFPHDPNKILVEDYVNSRSSVIYLVIINSIGIFFTLCLTIWTLRSNGKNNKKALEVYREHHQNHLDQICVSTEFLQKEINQININLNTISNQVEKINICDELKRITIELREIKEKIK
jgi:hypothetical protein